MTKRVLIVDDVEFSRVFEKSLIESIGKEKGIDFIIESAENIAEAIDKIKKNGGKIDYFIIDMNLPDGSGVEIAEFAKKYNPQAKILAITVYPSRYRKYKKIFDLYLPKPLKVDTYREKLSALLQD